MERILLNDIFNISEDEMKDYLIKVNQPVEDQNPLDFYLYDKSRFLEYVGWYKGTGAKQAHFVANRKYVIQFVKYIHPHQWLFTGVYKVGELKPAEVGDGQVYTLIEQEKFAKYSGRLVVHFKRQQGRVSTKYTPERDLQLFTVAEIKESIFEDDEFHGYENIHLPFKNLERIIHNLKPSWKSALSSVKGVYVITDQTNGKLYIGSAYGQEMIWSRWSEYVRSYHGGNKGLRKILNDYGKEYIEKNFTFALLETFKSTVEDSVIIQRESYWKDVLATRKHGYNEN